MPQRLAPLLLLVPSYGGLLPMVRNWVLGVFGFSVIGVVATTCVAWGATYNFYFNNVEQGPNGQASPSVMIQDGKLQGGTAQTLPVPEPVPSPTPADVAAPTAPTNPDAAPAKEPGTEGEATPTSAAAEVAFAPPQKRAKNWRFDLTGLTAMGDEQISGTLGFLFGLTWNPHPAIGFRGLIGGAMRDRYFENRSTYYSSTYPKSARASHPANGEYYSSLDDRSLVPVFGAEAEWNPIRVNFWGLEDWFSLGAVVGFSTLPAAQVNWSSIHTGVRVRMNLSENLGLLAQTRFNDRFATFEAGLTLGI